MLLKKVKGGSVFCGSPLSSLSVLLEKGRPSFPSWTYPLVSVPGAKILCSSWASWINKTEMNERMTERVWSLWWLVSEQELCLVMTNAHTFMIKQQSQLLTPCISLTYQYSIQITHKHTFTYYYSTLTKVVMQRLDEGFFELPIYGLTIVVHVNVKVLCTHTTDLFDV